MIREYLKTLAVGSLALAIVAVPAGDTVLRPRQGGGGGVRCAYYNAEFNEWDFVMPGDIISVQDRNGNSVEMQCGSDGKWHVIPRINTNGGPHANPGAGGGVYAP